MAYWLCIVLSLIEPATHAAPPRQEVNLNGPWEFRRDGSDTNHWKTVQLPSSLQSHEGADFHGVGWYRRTVGNLAPLEGKRLLLHFQAAATEAQVWWNGQKLGSHLGGWTPFRFDVTDLVRTNPPAAIHEVLVRLDERVGHNTQGFLPIIAPHFGGIWQGVSLHTVPETYVDDLQLLAVGEPNPSVLRVEAPIIGSHSGIAAKATLLCRLRGTSEWHEPQTAFSFAGGVLKAEASIPRPKLWSPGQPNLYEVELRLGDAADDAVRCRVAFRKIEAFGSEFRLNGSPVQIRGLLNWGYSPPAIEPNPGEAAWREELEFARARGFNLMKFCLWVPPKRYLELADEMGLLSWMEYPTWHPDFSARHLEQLRREFREFFAYDRNHPSVVLRSLTCETGPSADVRVIRDLYDMAHAMVPNSLVEDDSSWIGWNRIHDFYDDHPYGNNHDWVGRLREFNRHILAHGLKPMILGEAIAADTWPDWERLHQRFGNNRPWYSPGLLDESRQWTDKMRSLFGEGGLMELHDDSLRYGMLMRKYQMEAFRREIPYGGYVISVIRDIPNASMGLIDWLGQPKWSDGEWGWHRDTLCLLETPEDGRSFVSGDRIQANILLSHFGDRPIVGGTLRISLGPDAERGNADLQTLEPLAVAQNPATLAQVAALDWEAPQVEVPTRLWIRTELTTDTGHYENKWPVWIVPRPVPADYSEVAVHESVNPKLSRELFSQGPAFTPESRPSVVVASRFDPALAQYLEQGGRVLLLPDGERNSFSLSAHWFLRGAPYIPSTRLSRLFPREFLLELQHFDLASDVIPELPHLESLEPGLLLWDTHDLKDRVKTHGILFETGAGEGRLLVSALQHSGDKNAAGRWVLSRLLQDLLTPSTPDRRLPADVWQYLKERLAAQSRNLAELPWKFAPDPKNEGLEKGWHLPGYADGSWTNILVGAWWESQGFPALDKWAWYRLRLDVPTEWAGRDLFLSFEGVDDCYELYVNGEMAGHGGDLATRKDALGEKKSYNISRYCRDGAKIVIAIRVHDWYGAGGIYRPVTLGTLPFRPEMDFLK